MKVILAVKTGKGVKSSKKERVAALNYLQKLVLNIIDREKIKTSSSQGIPAKDGGKWIFNLGSK